MRSPNPRETILFWCISIVFGAGMLALLAAMCAAEISIHGDSSSPIVLTGEVAMDR
jgi:hypothetical protein